MKNCHNCGSWTDYSRPCQRCGYRKNFEKPELLRQAEEQRQAIEALGPFDTSNDWPEANVESLLNKALRAKCDRFEAALRKIVEMENVETMGEYWEVADRALKAENQITTEPE